MHNRGNFYDNAPRESLFRTLKYKLLTSDKLENRYKTEITIFDCNEIYYKQKLYISSKHRTPHEVHSSRIIS